MNKTIIRRVMMLSLLSLTLAVAQTTQPSGEARTTASGLKIVETKKLTEPLRVQMGDFIWVHYTGKLQGGTMPFDSSVGKEPLAFQLGVMPIIKGWEEGLIGMQVGDKRQLIIPPDLGYGAEGRSPRIPGNATLVFDVEMVGIHRPDTPPVK